MQEQNKLRKIVLAMHRGRPADPRDCDAWDRAVRYAEQLLEDETLLHAEAGRLMAELATSTVCTLSVTTGAGEFHVTHRAWSESGETIREARAAQLVDCLRHLSKPEPHLC